MSELGDIGLVGLGVMGQNLALNMERNGYRVIIYNRTTEKVDQFLASHGGTLNMANAPELADLVQQLKRPRRILMMVPAGKLVDQMIEALVELLDEADILIDGGNSHEDDTDRRVRALAERGFQYVGAGISGGEEGALKGPSIMPGGAPGAWEHVKPILQSIAARTPDGDICCDWVGEGGAGHFVKQVHNGIEYGDMQMICETFQLMTEAAGLSLDEAADTFERWNRGVLDSFLIEITHEILRQRDGEGRARLEQILDTAGQKGTGKNVALTALEAGQPLTLIAEAVFARYLSALKEERVAASQRLPASPPGFAGDRRALLSDLEQALYAAKIVSYTQGFQLMRVISHEREWKLRLGEVAMLWRAGCIIRSRFLGNIRDAFRARPDLANLLLDDFFVDAMRKAEPGWRRVMAAAVQAGIPTPALSSALAYYDGYRRARLPANLLQAQRDYFGAHTYERVDQPRGLFYHTDWIGDGQEELVADKRAQAE